MNNLPDILTVQQVANYLGWHRNTVYKRCISGELPSFKSGNCRRIRKAALLEWIKHMEGGGPDDD
ncbi:helix-turn-helix domain-containing protein [Heyndrickxia faecalis]|uniref:helix-turn-helix domain-containing protein n=1 Tax=Heyndrickxia faecalis TaxID=2824910 RepID=UPI003D1E4DF8